MSLLKRWLPSSKKKLVAYCIGSLALIVFSSLILFEATKAKVEVSENGEKQTVKTHANTVEELLTELDIVVSKHDELSHEKDASIKNGMNIELEEANEITLTVDEEEEDYHTTENTVGDFLASEGFNLSDKDKISHDKSEEVTDGLHVTLDKAYEITVNDGGKKQEVWTTGGSVEELLDELEISIGKHDKVKPALDKDVDQKTKVAITRVEKETTTVEEDLAFDVEEKEDSSLKKGEEKVITEGKKGKVEKKYEIISENGKEVDRKLLDENVTTDGENKVVAIGTKEEQKQEVVTLSDEKKKDSNEEKSNDTNNTNNTNDSNDNKEESSKSESKSDSDSGSDSDGEVMYMDATAFTADCSGCSGYTATGINLNENPDMKVIAVDPNVIPLGSTVWVEGYGTAIAGDTGGAIQGNRIDAHVPTQSEANSFGRKKVKVKIID